MKAGSIIKLLRTVNGISQDELAGQLGVTRGYLSQVENGREPSLAFLRDVSREFEIPVALLLVEEGEQDSEILKELRRLLAELLTARVTLWTQPQG
jgi:transcriptional regulator with XRE-family HTH domain